LDFGYPQHTDMGVLKTFITQAGIKSQVCVLPFIAFHTAIVFYYHFKKLLCNVDGIIIRIGY